MTELQLQAIVNQQGIEGTGESNLDMTIVNGVSVSKWHLDSVTYGKEVSDTLKESVRKYLQQFVGGERVFPTQNDAPRIMTEFLNKPYRFELRDETNPIVSSCVTSTRRAPILTIADDKGLLLSWEACHAEGPRALLPQHSRSIQLRQSKVLIAPDRP